jgi:CO dehydrogenase maturation factor
MKIAISGKGGVGKTTLAAMLAGACSLSKRDVIAVDADPDSNLSSALGIPAEERIIPLAEMTDLIAERTGKGENFSGYFKINPKVDDIPERYCRKIGRVRLLVLGGVSHGGTGCLCPASALLRALLLHLTLGRGDALVMDMEAGIEHLGRATAQSMDALIVVVDSGPWSAQTALRVRKLAKDIGIGTVLAVANRIDDESQLAPIAARLEGIPLIGHMPTDARLQSGIGRSDSNGDLVPSDAFAEHLPVVIGILAEIEKRASRN